MLSYRHYSFDLWLTLIRSNPLFKQERTRYFHQHFNHQHKTIEEIAFIFRQVDLMVNAINEKTGKNIDADEMYLMVISLINNGNFPFQNIDLLLLEQEMENLLFKYLPSIYCSQTVKVLDHLFKTGKNTISILSNTGFISGKTLRKVLEKLNLDDYFNFQLYSDEAGMSKPNPDFFKMMLANAATTNAENLDPKQIIHIGDNATADISGANSVGICSLLINSNQQCISTLIN